MSEALVFNCPSCGASLHASDDTDTINCPYCHNTVIVPPELRRLSQPAPLTLDLQEIRDQLATGERIEVVKRVRRATGLGLKEAEDVVEAVERGDNLQAAFELIAAFMPGSQAADDPVVEADLKALAGETAQPPTSLDARQAAKAFGVVGGSLSCIVIGSIALVLAVVVISLGFAFSQQGGPLAPLVNRLNPAAWVKVELQFGEAGIGPGQFTDPRTVAADPAGNIYAGDFGTGRLQSFDSQGNFRWLVNLGEDQYIQSLGIDRSNVLLVVSRGVIRRFDTADGRELGPFPNPQEAYFEDLYVAPDGRIAVIANSEDVLVYDDSYNLVLSIPQAVSSVTADSELDSDIAIDGLGNLYVLGHFNGSVFKYDPQGVFTNRISSEGDETSQLSAPGDLSVDGQGRLYVSDIYGVKIFSSDGRYLDKFDLSGYVAGLNFDAQDRLYSISNEPRLMRLALRK